MPGGCHYNTVAGTASLAVRVGLGPGDTASIEGACKPVQLLKTLSDSMKDIPAPFTVPIHPALAFSIIGLGYYCSLARPADHADWHPSLHYQERDSEPYQVLLVADFSRCAEQA